jgi:hypothetical protein
MPQAAKKATTNKSKKNPDTALAMVTPEKVEYIARNAVRVHLKTCAGDPLTYTMTPKDLAKSVRMSMALINEHATTINIEF